MESGQAIDEASGPCKRQRHGSLKRANERQPMGDSYGDVD
jgi:hypothetical protein